LAATSTGSSLEEKFRELEGGDKIDEELRAMKRQLPGTQRGVVGQLPPASLSATDLEYERLLRELRGK